METIHLGRKVYGNHTPRTKGVWKHVETIHLGRKAYGNYTPRTNGVWKPYPSDESSVETVHLGRKVYGNHTPRPKSVCLDVVYIDSTADPEEQRATPSQVSLCNCTHGLVNGFE